MRPLAGILTGRVLRDAPSRTHCPAGTFSQGVRLAARSAKGRRELEEFRAAGRMVELRVLGLATLTDDVSPELALATIASVEVLGAFRAPRAVKAALVPRMV